ncbi:EGF-like domain protein [Dictyocaulus viviparus]|uniref:EGF-like domain protein n=1 Tax=Dictyocaulus viviparus TaxID=29172 RepID=A0A0D8XDR1_DICVI|nr:EGF-like domain protein [Dictyocaulus viviparus]
MRSHWIEAWTKNVELMVPDPAADVLFFPHFYVLQPFRSAQSLLSSRYVNQDVFNIGFNIGLLSCKPELNGLLAVDPNGNPSTYLVCRSSGLNSVGYWERKACPDNTVFDFVKQQCRQKNHQRPPMMNIVSCLCLRWRKWNENFQKMHSQSTPSSFLPNLSHLNAISNILKPQWFNLNSLDINNTVQNSLKTYKNGSSYDHNELHGHGIKSSTVELRNETHELSNMSGRIGTTSQPTFVFQPNVRTSTPYSEQTKTVTMLAGPGQSCQRHEVCTGGSVCTQPISLCLCPGELVEKNGECVLPSTAVVETVEVGIGEACSERTKCSYGSSCVMGRCACVAPLIEYNGLCIIYGAHKEVGPGEPCDGGVICTRGSVCDSAIPVCVCPKNTDLKDGVCVSLMTASKPYHVTIHALVTRPTKNQLQSTSDYYSGNSHKNTVHSTTSSPSLATSNTTEHLPFVPQRGQLLDKYNSSSMISEPDSRTHVSNYTILTSMPMKPFGTAKHIKVPSVLTGSRQFGVGVTCSLNTDCMIGAYCNGNTNPPSCQCLSTHVDVEGRCEHENTSVNKKCGTHNDYPQCSNGFLCINNFCVCPSPYSINNDSCSTNQTNQVLSSCDEACRPPRSCLNNRCVCVEDTCMNYERSLSHNRSRRHIEKSMVCWPGATQCSAGNGVCIDNVCHCINGFVQTDGVCAPEVAALNEKCDPNHISPRCTDNAICINNICTCVVPGGCTGDFVIGHRFSVGRCQTDRQCSNGRCIAGKCQCNDGFTLQTGICVSLIGAFKNINSQCTIGDRCSGGSTCRDHVCQCVDGSYEHHNRCHQSLGGRCTYGQTCEGGSSCDFGVCRCPEGNIIEAGKCVTALSKPGGSCQLGQKCVHGSACRFGMCICIANYVASEGKCIRTVNILPSGSTSKIPPIDVGTMKGPGHKCHEKDLCSGGSFCLEGFCVCKESEVIINEQCVGSHERAIEIVEKLQIAAPGQPCGVRTDCAGGSKCINQTCTCEQSVIDETGICSEGKRVYSTNAAMPRKHSELSQPGAICTLTIECPYRTECVRGVCRCKKGETIINSTCRKAIHHVLPGGRCDPRKGYDCIGESHCFYGICICTRHLVNNGKECVTVAETSMAIPGGRCNIQQICSGGANCVDGVCKCPDDEVPDVNKKCIKKSQVYLVFDKFPTINQKTSGYNSYSFSKFNPNPKDFMSSYSNLALKTGELEALETLLKENPSMLEPGEMSLTMNGHICQNNDNCPANAFCFQDLCRCLIGFYAKGSFCEIVSDGCNSSLTSQNQRCTKLAEPGMSCTNGEVCSFGSYCSPLSGGCECPSGMATINSRCEKTTLPRGSACITSHDCHISSYCDNGLCLCKVGFNLIDNRCTPIIDSSIGVMESLEGMNPNNFKFSKDTPPLDGAYQLYASTAIPSNLKNLPSYFELGSEEKSAHINPELWQLTSSFSYYPFAVKHQANVPITFAKGRNTNSQDVGSEYMELPLKFKVSMPGDSCGNDSICIGNSICQHQFCRCPANTFNENGLCTVMSHMSLKSKYNHEQLKSIENHDEDRQFAAPLENCQNFELCTGGAECSNIQGMGLVCQCPMNTILLEGDCVEVPRNANLSGIGESCQNGELCLGGSRCVLNVCMCEENRHDILGICVKTVRPGDDCSNGEICVDGSICAASLRTCICPEGRSSYLGRCVDKGNSLESSRTRSPGSACGYPFTCDDNSFCSAEDKKCISSALMKHPGDECFPEDICTSGSECIYSVCVCPNGQLLIEGKCVRISSEVRKTSIKVECDSDVDCAEHYRCLGGLCVCHATSSHCLPTRHVRNTVFCTEDSHCAANATCIDYRCICNEGYQNINNVCILNNLNEQKLTSNALNILTDVSSIAPKVNGPGALCSSSNSCVMGSLCVNKYCLCGFDSVPKNGMCVVKNGNVDIGERCSDEYRCRDGLLCLSDRCSCPDEGISCNDGRMLSCLASEPATSPPGGSCTDNQLCTGGSVCRNGLCICSDPTMIAQRGICIQSAPRQTVPTVVRYKGFA